MNNVNTGLHSRALSANTAFSNAQDKDLVLVRGNRLTEIKVNWYKLCTINVSSSSGWRAAVQNVQIKCQLYYEDSGLLIKYTHTNTWQQMIVKQK